MKYLLVVLAVFCGAFPLMCASDLEEEAFVVHDRQVRQATCITQTDCLPAALQNASVPNDIVFCSGGFCTCRQCFEIRNNLCMDQAPCWTYNIGTRSCDDSRKSQLTAFLLSLFLSYVGAANFYIERGDLAGGQLAMFLITFLVAYLAFIPCCLFCCCADSEGGMACAAVVNIIVMVIGIILVTAASLILTAWWIADLVIFVENTRMDGNNCPLSPTLTGSS